MRRKLSTILKLNFCKGSQIKSFHNHRFVVWMQNFIYFIASEPFFHDHHFTRNHPLQNYKPQTILLQSYRYSYQHSSITLAENCPQNPEHDKRKHFQSKQTSIKLNQFVMEFQYGIFSILIHCYKRLPQWVYISFPFY